MDLESEVELYESDIKRINEVCQKLGRWVGTKSDYDAFFNEAQNLFNNAGFAISIQYKVYADGSVPDQMPYQFTITSRLRKEAFDHERQSWEVQHNVLGSDPNPGAIQPDGRVKSVPQVTVIPSKP